MQIALSNAVLQGLESRLEEMGALKEEREGRLAEMHDVLNDMWNMLDIPESNENRTFFQKMLQAPARLHCHTLEKVCLTARLFIAVYFCSWAAVGTQPKQVHNITLTQDLHVTAAHIPSKGTFIVVLAPR
jgi:hypothetical protein